MHCTIAFHSASARAPVLPAPSVNSEIMNVAVVPIGIVDVFVRASLMLPKLMTQPPTQRFRYSHGEITDSCGVNFSGGVGTSTWLLPRAPAGRPANGFWSSATAGRMNDVTTTRAA